MLSGIVFVNRTGLRGRDAPRVTYTRNFSIISLYDQKRLLAELGVTQAF
ncbi:hypothetical protein HNQ99_002183 [Rhizorhapis suberifaciens]|uniref:Uncharacterized protein n=1 Tax=Rhizorhapis suberifaciens TaxID=13656 RepID=A0A840HUY9_9SPHN|nr:hypothetical protein [Rhizorhapis suberifaciens]